MAIACLNVVEYAGNTAEKYHNYTVNPPSAKFPHFYRFWEFPTNLNFVPTNWLKFPKLGKFPPSINTEDVFGGFFLVF